MRGGRKRPETSHRLKPLRGIRSKTGRLGGPKALICSDHGLVQASGTQCATHPGIRPC